MTSWLNDSITDPNLRQSVEDVISSYPATRGVIQRLVTYFENRPSEREGKRRKVASDDLTKDEVVRIVDVSFQLPSRKKYNIVITKSHFLLYNTKTNDVEFSLSIDDFTFGCCVPSPDKPSFSFVLFAKEDAIVFTVLDKGDMTIKSAADASDRVISNDKHESICELLTKHVRVEMSQPSKTVFKASGVSDTTGKLTDKSHVNAYLKAKDGSLYFLPKGILFGFKKPALFFPVTSLSSIVITGVTQRTFDLTLILKENATVLGAGSAFKPTREGDHDTVQFSMISQSEYTGIDEYIKRADINDHSMAEERKAPVVNKQENNKTAADEDVDADNKGNDEDSEEDDDFEPSEDDNDPLEYDTDPEDDEDNEKEEEETERNLEAEERHEYEDAEMEDEEDEVDLLDESD